MKHFMAASLLFLTVAAWSQKNNKIVPFDETYRPQFHYTLSENWLGSPVALFQQDSIYHLYYQQNTFNLIEGYMQWGMATSSDLLFWKEEKISNLGGDIVPDSSRNSMIWGTIVNQNGLDQTIFQRKDVGIFTSSSSDGRLWSNLQQVTGNNFDGNGEPFLFWHQPTQKWVVLVFNRERSVIQILNSSDLKSWEQTSEFSFKFGLPSMVELPVDGRVDDTRWVLFCEKGVYIVCNFDGKALNPDGPVAYFDQGKSVKGSTLLKSGDRTFLISGLTGSNFADLPTAGLMSFPNEVSLTRLPEGITLMRKPIAELDRLQNKKSNVINKKVYPGLKNNPLSGLKGRSVRIKATIDIYTCNEMAFLIRSDKKQNGSIISYDAKRGFFNVLGNSISYAPADKKIQVEIIVDRSSIEVYLENGRYAFSSTFSPSPEGNYYELITTGGEAIVDAMEYCTLNSIWK